MNIFELKRRVLQARQGDAGGGTGGVGNGSNAGMGGGSGSSGGSRGSVGSSTSNYGSRQGFSGATSYGGGVGGGDGGSIGDGSDTANSRAVSAKVAKAAADRAAAEQAAAEAQATSDRAAAEQARAAEARAAESARQAQEAAARDKESDDRDRMAKETKAQALVDANPNKIDGISAMIGVTSNFSKDADAREVSPGGWTYGQTETLSNMGYGNLAGVNANNPTQTVAQALASKNVHDNIMPAVSKAIMGLSPYGAALTTGLKMAKAIDDGMSFADAAKQTAVDIGAGWAASKVNEAVGPAIAGVVGPENMAALGLASTVSSAFGGPSMPNVGGLVAQAGVNALGLGSTPSTGYNNTSTSSGFASSGGGLIGGGNGGGSGISTFGLGGVGQPTVASVPSAPTATGLIAGVDARMFDAEQVRRAKAEYFQRKGVRNG